MVGARFIEETYEKKKNEKKRNKNTSHSKSKKFLRSVFKNSYHDNNR